MNGPLILPALAWEAWQQHRDSREPEIPSRLWRYAWLALVPLGLISYMVYLHFHVGDAFAFLKAQTSWGRMLAMPGEGLWLAYHGSLKAYAVFSIATAVAALVILVSACWRGVRRSMLVYTTLMLLLFLSSSLSESLPRYLSILFPLYLALALATDRSQGAFTAAIALSTALLALSTALFACGYWMT